MIGVAVLPYNFHNVDHSLEKGFPFDPELLIICHLLRNTHPNMTDQQAWLNKPLILLFTLPFYPLVFSHWVFFTEGYRLLLIYYIDIM